MADQTFAPIAPQEPKLRKKPFDPKGVMQKNAKAGLFLGVAALVFLALIFSAKGKTSPHRASTQAAPQPLVQDNTESNVAEMKSQVADQQERWNWPPPAFQRQPRHSGRQLNPSELLANPVACPANVCSCACAVELRIENDGSPSQNVSVDDIGLHARVRGLLGEELL